MCWRDVVGVELLLVDWMVVSVVVSERTECAGEEKVLLPPPPAPSMLLRAPAAVVVVAAPEWPASECTVFARVGAPDRFDCEGAEWSWS